MTMRLRMALMMMAVAMTAGLTGFAQTTISPGALRRQVERRFDVLPLHDGIALHPKSRTAGVQSVEITDDSIAIDGVPASGRELRDKFGSDADLILKISYLDADGRREFIGRTPQPAPAVEPPTPPEPREPSPPPPPARPQRTRHSDDRVRIGGSVTVDADESVNDVVVIGGNVRIDGEVTNDVVAIGGTVRLGPTAEVGRDITVVGGMVARDQAARIGGRINEIGPGINFRGWHWRAMPFIPMYFFGSMWGGFFALMSTLVRFGILCALASIVLLIAGDYVERVGTHAAAEPIKAGFVGLLAQLLFLPLLVVTIVLLVITIIGIPLLVLVPFAILALLIFCVVGFTAVAYHVGRLVSARLGSTPPNPYLTAIVGIVAVMSPVLVGRILGLAGGLLFPLTGALAFLGFLLEYVAWTVGLGAVALSRFNRGPTVSPPPAPAA